MPRIGAVVIGRNEGPRLDRCLASIGPVRQIVYADSASTDNSVEIARSHGAEVVVLLADSAFTAARGRNAGARRLIEMHPDIEYIQFIDGDCEMQSEWLPAAQAFLDDRPQVAVVCGQRFERFPDASIYNRMCDREWNTPVGQAESSGGDSLVRRDAFQQANGFRDDQMAHEEPEFCSRLRAIGWHIWRIDVRMTKHDAAMTRYGQYYRRSRRAGFGIMQCIHRAGTQADGVARAMLARSVLWGIMLPLLIATLALASYWQLAAIAALLYPAQWLRSGFAILRRGGWSLAQSLRVSAITLSGKFGEVHGIGEYWLGELRNKKAQTIFYK